MQWNSKPTILHQIFGENVQLASYTRLVPQTMHFTLMPRMYFTLWQKAWYTLHQLPSCIFYWLQLTLITFEYLVFSTNDKFLPMVYFSLENLSFVLQTNAFFTKKLVENPISATKLCYTLRILNYIFYTFPWSPQLKQLS